MFLFVKLFFWCPCMAINVSVQYNWASPRHYTVDPMLKLIPSGNPFKWHEDILSLQPMIPPKRFDISPPVWDAQKVYMRSDFSLNRVQVGVNAGSGLGSPRGKIIENSSLTSSSEIFHDFVIKSLLALSLFSIISSNIMILLSV